MDVEYRNFHGPSDWGVVQKYLPLHRVDDTGGIVAVDTDTNDTVGLVVFDSWTTTSVQVHQIVINPMVLRHGFFEEACDYVFSFAERELMIGLVPSDNEKAWQMNRKIGFEIAATVKDGMAYGVDTVIMTMTKEQCNFWSAPEVKETAHG